MLDADGVRVAQIVANLLNNAAKYTPPGGQIWLGARREAEEIVISVRDTGIGIATDKLPRVFDMFAQVQSPDRPTAGGLGIGLTLVKRLAEMHGGSVAVQSEGAGKGSEFTVRLPLPRLVEQPAASHPKAKERAAPLAGRRILVVDDNRDAADSMGMFLKFLGAKMHVAYDGASALAAMAMFGPDVVLLDIGMPGMDGYEVARRIRRQPEHQGVLLLAMTGWGQEEDRRRTAEAGFDHHLVKPVDPLALQTLLVTGSAGGNARPGGVPRSSVFSPGGDRK
jgi:CheY-like chemotaxis protein/anti-sigma regulatory factor (Ser/Thr protein kinase)